MARNTWWLLFPFLAGPCFGDALSPRVDALFQPWNSPASPGCAVAVVRAGQVLHQRCYGSANLDLDAPITPKTAFYLPSTTKQFTAALALLLARRGALGLDRSIRQYVPDLPAYADKVAVRHLLGHTSGIRDYLAMLALAGSEEDAAPGESQVLALLARQKELQFEPGTEYQYSNSNYFLLGLAMRRATNTPLPQLADGLVFRPLGMKGTAFLEDRSAVLKNRATGYTRAGYGRFRVSSSTPGVIGDSGVFSTLEDLIAWEGNFFANKLDPADLIEQMTKPGKLADGRATGYGYGLFLRSYRGLGVVSHPGGYRGYRSELLRFPASRLSVICLCNSADANAGELARRVADIYLEGRFPAPGPAPRFLPAKRENLPIRPGPFRDLVNETLWRLVWDGKSLVVHAVGEPPFRLAPVSATEMRSPDPPYAVRAALERRDGRERLVVYAGEREPFILEPLNSNTPLTPSEVTQYFGEYYSEELDATYRLWGGNLPVLSYPGAPQVPLEPTGPGEFQGPGFRLQFFREDGKVAGFRLSTVRARGMVFRKK